ncbi:MAG TPA: flagellar biosynthetic protein FliO [Polyangia bacterium]
MLTQLALLPILAVTVTGVTSQARDTEVVVDVTTSEPISPSRIRPMAGHRLLYLFVNDSTSAQETFANGKHSVTARARTSYTKLEIPLDPGVRCYEPAEVGATASGLRVQFSCSTSSAASAEVTAETEMPAPRAHREKKPATPAPSQELLKAALALPEELAYAAKTEMEQEDNPPGKPSDGDRKTATGQPARELKEALAAAIPLAPLPKVPAPAAEGTDKPLPARIDAGGIASVKAATTPLPTESAAPAANAAPPVAASAESSRGSSWFALVVVLLVGVAGGVLALTRRRGRHEGLIKILETAAIGPKRTLLVARVNGQTMVLGASEAGIALLGSLDGKMETPVAPVMENLPKLMDRFEKASPVEATEPALASESEPEDDLEPDGEFGVLRRLFRRKRKLTSERDDAAFRELLEDSFGDQELRDRLAHGLTAKVS